MYIMILEKFTMKLMPLYIAFFLSNQVMIFIVVSCMEHSEFHK
jgi:hypothetical protein